MGVRLKPQYGMVSLILESVWTNLANFIANLLDCPFG